MVRNTRRHNRILGLAQSGYSRLKQAFEAKFALKRASIYVLCFPQLPHLSMADSAESDWTRMTGLPPIT
jgi:hypothetical protein